MVVPVLLSIACLALSAWAVAAGLPDLLLIFLPSALAALVLLLRARRHPAAPAEAPLPARRGLFRRSPAPPPRWIVVDGSNVLHWQDNVPRLSTLRAVLADLSARGYTPGVVFDANAGYKISDRYQHDGALGKLLGLPADRVLVAPKGNPADPLILAAARDLGARIVSNDRFRDWVETHPEVATPGQLIRGGYRDGRLWLDLD